MCSEEQLQPAAINKEVNGEMKNKEKGNKVIEIKKTKGNKRRGK